MQRRFSFCHSLYIHLSCNRKFLGFTPHWSRGHWRRGWELSSLRNRSTLGIIFGFRFQIFWSLNDRTASTALEHWCIPAVSFFSNNCFEVFYDLNAILQITNDICLLDAWRLAPSSRLLSPRYRKSRNRTYCSPGELKSTMLDAWVITFYGVNASWYVVPHVLHWSIWQRGDTWFIHRGRLNSTII